VVMAKSLTIMDKIKLVNAKNGIWSGFSSRYTMHFSKTLSNPDSTFDTRNLEASMEVPVGAEIDRYKAFCASS
jgi:hypothetical protein